jgi:predicted aspartyl protease
MKTLSAKQFGAGGWFSSSIRWALGVVVALTAGCGGGVGVVRAVDVQVPMTLYSKHVVVDVRINGEPARFLLDSGASHNTVTEQLATRLQLKRSDKAATGSGAGGNYEAYWVALDDLRVGNESNQASRQNQIAFIVPVPADFTYDGILGTAFLEAFVVTVDYTAKTVRLQSRDVFTPPKGAAVIPMQRLGNLITVQAQVAGHTGTCQIDTGASNAVTIMRPAVERLGLRSAFSPSVRALTGRSAGGDVRGDMVRVPEVAIGPFVLRQVVTELSLAEAGLFATPALLCNLGGEVWRRFTVTLDYGGQQLYLAPNVALAAPFLYGRGGLVIGLDQELSQSQNSRQYRVLDTLPSGPAARAGVVTGDALVSINGIAQHLLDGPAIQALLLQAAGTKFALQLHDAQGRPKSAIVILEDLI